MWFTSIHSSVHTLTGLRTPDQGQMPTQQLTYPGSKMVFVLKSLQSIFANAEEEKQKSELSCSCLGQKSGARPYPDRFFFVRPRALAHIHQILGGLCQVKHMPTQSLCVCCPNSHSGIPGHTLLGKNQNLTKNPQGGFLKEIVHCFL